MKPDDLKIDGAYNWRNQPERLVYMGPAWYPGDLRRWHQFARVEKPGSVWSEVLDSDLHMIEATLVTDGVSGRHPQTESPKTSTSVNPSEGTNRREGV